MLEKVERLHDVCVGECPLKITFPHLFEICHQQDWSVQGVCNQGGLALAFRRNPRDGENLELAELSDSVANVSLSECSDSSQDPSQPRPYTMNSPSQFFLIVVAMLMENQDASEN